MSERQLPSKGTYHYPGSGKYSPSLTKISCKSGTTKSSKISSTADYLGCLRDDTSGIYGYGSFSIYLAK